MIKLLFSGDFAPLIHPDQSREDHFALLEQYFQESDLHVTNLECPLTTNDLAVKKTGPSLKGPPEGIKWLKQANVQLVCLANNHIYDYGEQGINDTIKICEQNMVDTMGIVNRSDGRNASFIKVIKDKRMGFVNFCEHEYSVRKDGHLGAHGYDDIDAFYYINQLRREVDYLTVLYHGGNEFYPLPSPMLKKTFHYLADLGADAVIGHHTHVFSGFEIYKGKPLIYSLGNFFFPEHNEHEGWYTGMLCFIVISNSSEVDVEFFPVLQNPDNYHLSPPSEPERVRIFDKFKNLSTIIEDNKMLHDEWESFARERGRNMYKLLLHSSKLERLFIKFGFIRKIMTKFMKVKRRKMLIYNAISCQSLRNIMLHKLK